MHKNAELVRLEEFVDKLLIKYNQLKSDYTTSQVTLRERDAECADLKNTLSQLSADRTEAGNRVSGLLDRIEQWEAEQNMPQVEESSSYGSAQAELFKVDVDGRDDRD